MAEDYSEMSPNERIKELQAEAVRAEEIEVNFQAELQAAIKKNEPKEVIENLEFEKKKANEHVVQILEELSKLNSLFTHVTDTNADLDKSKQEIIRQSFREPRN